MKPLNVVFYPNILLAIIEDSHSVGQTDFFDVIYFSGLGKWEMPSRRNESCYKSQLASVVGLCVYAIRPVITTIAGRFK